jgi:hypothetical protein
VHIHDKELFDSSSWSLGEEAAFLTNDVKAPMSQSFHCLGCLAKEGLRTRIRGVLPGDNDNGDDDDDAVSRVDNVCTIFSFSSS